MNYYLHYVILIAFTFRLSRSAEAARMNISFPLRPLVIYVGETRLTSFNLTYSCDVPIELRYHSDEKRVAVVTNSSLKILPPANYSLLVGSVELRAKRLGGAKLSVEILCNGTNSSSTESTINPWSYQIISLRKLGVVDLVFRIIIIIMVIFLTFVMGCELDPVMILNYLRKPIAPAIGFCSQFVLMPLISFGLSMAMPIAPEFGFGLLTIGCSPGGGASNIWTLLLNGDLNLSMTMTFLSSVGAIGMMPLWLYIFGRFFIDVKSVKIPYNQIVLNLLQVVVPVFFGMGLRWWKVAIADKLKRLVRPLALLFIVYILTFGTYVQLYIYELMGDYPLLLPAGALLPWAGFVLGYIMAILSCQTKKQAVTIAIETGIQNIGIAILILAYSMPQPQGDLAVAMPIVVAVFTPIPLYIALFVLTIKRRFFTKLERPQTEVKDSSDTEKEVSVKLLEIPPEDKAGPV